MSNSNEMAQEELQDDRVMPLTAHLEELRRRLVRSFIAIGVCFAFVYYFSKQVMLFLQEPVLQAFPEGATPFALLRLPEGFFTELKASLLVAVCIAMPYLLFQAWRFVAPGLYPREKIVAIPMMIFATIFFFIGASFAYYIVFPIGFQFFLAYAEGSVIASLSLSWYLTFVVKLIMAFGIAFELPLIVFVLSRLGLVTAEKMRKGRKIAILIIFGGAAILTPPDIVTQVMMAGPMIVLYEGSIFIAKIFGKKPDNYDLE
ncbi:twin-arginine translocase subunit TatC [Desulfurispira natronophila]|uniref:Sec-independent protein translocase protein TatC n=1 Tax=Desulfurispira natronophila TaxID=682562 RepID=A0A7W7Y3B1_9BACT|nr:twin-arginine translocase subunit TatC [Desulfurispira natronophila]MBB5021326.1 sec-independent protein translocase protein TatC [Desulfurispira natronophila]